MPLIRVELFDYRMSDETSAALIEKLTDALGEATHPGLKEHTWVIVEGHNPKNWGLAGKPWPVDQMPPAPHRGGQGDKPGAKPEARLSAGFVGEASLRSRTVDNHRDCTPAGAEGAGLEPEPTRVGRAGCQPLIPPRDFTLRR